MFMEALMRDLVLLPATLVYVTVGLMVFALAFWIITKVTPFSIRKEIEEDQNTALAIIIGSVILALGIVIAAAIT